jgi:hypothetical protein
LLRVLIFGFTPNCARAILWARQVDPAPNTQVTRTQRTQIYGGIPVKYLAILWVLMLAATVGFATQEMPSADTNHKQPATTVAKQTRWKGRIVRLSEDQSILTIRGGPSSRDTVQREVLLNSATRWTKVGKPAEQSEFKEGSYVIVVGKPDKQGRLEAINIDLRPGR